jgi:glycerol-3-phosphate dehydrogenase (NAD(P)+)
MQPITILGAGSWGTALSILMARNGHKVRLWGRDKYMRDLQQLRYNKQYLPDIVLPDSIQIELDFNIAVEQAEDILIAVPSAAFRSILNDIYAIKSKGLRIAWATKGLDEKRNQLLHEVVFEIFDKNMPIAIVAGPSFAKEVAVGLPTAITLTSNDQPFEQRLTALLHGYHFRVYSQPDLIGVQICGAVKNCLAVATGISDGLGYGANARSALITRGLAEMTRLGLAMGGQQETFMGLAGIGDLILTCTDNQSRNRRFGFAVGQGVGLDEAEKSVGQVVEGRRNAFNVSALADQYQTDMPIVEQVCRVLTSAITPYESVEQLFARQPKPESL